MAKQKRGFEKIYEVRFSTDELPALGISKLEILANTPAQAKKTIIAITKPNTAKIVSCKRRKDKETKVLAKGKTKSRRKPKAIKPSADMQKVDTPADPPANPPDRVKAQIDAAVEIHDPGPPEGAAPAAGAMPSDKATPAPDGAPEPAPVAKKRLAKLSPGEWDILRDCALLDENDADNGKRLLNWFGDTILHVSEGGWMTWNSTHWDSEVGQHAAERQAHKVAELIKRESGIIEASPEEKSKIDAAADLLEKFPDPKDRPADVRAEIAEATVSLKHIATRRMTRFKFGTRSGDRPRTRAMIDQAEPHRSVLPAVLDQDHFAFNVKNGTLRFNMVEDVESDPDDPRHICEISLDKHNPADMITKCADCAYDPDADAPIWKADLMRFQPDVGTRLFLQVFMGYCILGVTGEQCYAFFYGDGANWKSAFLQSIARTVGTYFKPQSYTSVSGTNMPTGDKPSPDWARLPGVRLLTIEEVPRKEPIREELIKLLTSGSAMPVRHLNKGMFDLIPSFTCIMTSNAEPNIGGHDKGIWRRTLIVPWDETIDEADQLPFEQVMAIYDAERQGILNWLLEGVKLYRTQGLLPFITDRMREFTHSVRSDRDSAGSFVEDCVRVVERDEDGMLRDGHITTAELYAAYVQWCSANGVDPVLNAIAFGRQVKRNKVGDSTLWQRKSKVQGIRRYNGVTLYQVPPAAPERGMV